MKRKGESDTWAKEKDGVKWHDRTSEIGGGDEQKDACGGEQLWNARVPLAPSLAGACPVNYFLLLWRGGMQFITSFFSSTCTCLSWAGKGEQFVANAWWISLSIHNCCWKSLEICKIETQHAQNRFDTEQRCEICQKLKAVLVTSGPLWFFFFLSRTWFYWNNDSYMFYSCAF